MEEVTISESKAKCLALREQLYKTKKPIRVTRFGKPAADVVPPVPATERADWLMVTKPRYRLAAEMTPHPALRAG